MGRRSRRRGRPDLPELPPSRYEGAGGTIALRGVLTPRTRAQYAEVRAGRGGAQTAEDAWQRAVEYLFERLTVSWTASGVEYAGAKELLARFRASSPEERRWLRDVLREHVAEHFPDVDAP